MVTYRGVLGATVSPDELALLRTQLTRSKNQLFTILSSPLRIAEEINRPCQFIVLIDQINGRILRRNFNGTRIKSKSIIVLTLCLIKDKI